MESNEHYICPDRSCAAGTWVLEGRDQLRNLWLLVSASGDSAWLLAADEPVCPSCGASLLTLLELEGGYTTGEVIEEGPLLHWMQTLGWTHPAA